MSPSTPCKDFSLHLVQIDRQIMEISGALNLNIDLWHKSIAISFVITNVLAVRLEMSCILGYDINKEDIEQESY